MWVLDTSVLELLAPVGLKLTLDLEQGSWRHLLVPTSRIYVLQVRGEFRATDVKL